jgi:serine/threonine-protein kinase
VTSTAQAPREFGSYTLHRELGRGGMATVYLGQDLRHDRQVAIKILHPDLGAALGAERFLTEIKTTAKLQHPHILPLLDSGERDGLLFYVMPFVAGETLRARLERERQLPVGDALRIAREVADALAYAHAHGIVHRDIKPENILLQDDHALVADFGISLAVQHAGERLTQTGLSLGTPQYMSPEQAMGERNIDHRADIYALGAVTFEMLAGEPPFTGPTIQAIVAKILTDEPRSLGSLRRSVPEHVDAAVLAALQKLPADRTPTAHAFAESLDATGTSASGPATIGRPMSSGAQPSVVNPLTIALASVAVAALAVAGWQWRVAHTGVPQLVSRFMVESPTDARMTVRAPAGPGVAISPDGRALAFVAVSADGTPRVHVRTLADLVPHALPGTEGASQPFFSPDGHSIAFRAAGRLHRIATDGGSPLPMGEAAEYLGGTWSRGGIVLAIKGRLSVVPTDTGKPRPLGKLDSARHELYQDGPVALDDGDHVLYASWGNAAFGDVKIGIASISAGTTRVLDVAAIPLGVLNGQLIAVAIDGTISATPIDVAKERITGGTVAVGTGVTIGTDGIVKAALSHSGVLVYYGGLPESEVVLVDGHGGTRPVLSERRAYGFPRFSPDGKRIALTISAGTSSDIWIHDLPSHTTTRLTRKWAINDRPEWTPDGKRVLYRAHSSSYASIWWVPADRSADEALLLAGGPAAAFSEAVITPDGKRIVYERSDIESRLLEGDAKPMVLASRASMPRVSNDGRWLAYVSQESGAREVVVQSLSGPGARVQVSANGGTEPVWSRDDHRLFYRSGGSIVAAEVVRDPTFAVRSRTKVMDDVYLHSAAPHANYDVAPDGSLLLLRGTDADRLIVVQNWGEEVRARARQPR